MCQKRHVVSLSPCIKHCYSAHLRKKFCNGTNNDCIALYTTAFFLLEMLAVQIGIY
jgi:hypothetical protein